MYESTHNISGILRWLGLGILILVTVLVIFSVFLPAPQTSASPESSQPSDSSLSMPDSPNAVTNGMAAGADSLSAAAASTGRAVKYSGQSVAATVSRSGKFMGHSLVTGASMIGRGLGSGVLFTARATGSGIAAVADVPSHIMGLAADTAVVSAVIKPAGNSSVPTIDTTVPVKIAAHDTLPDAKTVSLVAPVPVSPPKDTDTAWPIHGEITTLFGVPELPYQAIHTGLDISDGLPSGTTPIRPFKSGRVVQVIRSYSGLGNHVVVDHGGGLTSVYGHLYSISVQEGQQVDGATILGYEGSTGVSTGTHLHFEIRVNGQPVDPHQFITGQP